MKINDDSGSVVGGGGGADDDNEGGAIPCSSFGRTFSSPSSATITNRGTNPPKSGNPHKPIWCCHDTNMVHHTNIILISIPPSH